MKIFVLLMINSLACTSVIAQTAGNRGYNDKFEGIITQLKHFSIEEICADRQMLHCIQGSRVDFSAGHCKESVAPIVNECIDAHRDGLKSIFKELARGNMLSELRLMHYTVTDIDPCIEQHISIAQGRKPHSVEECLKASMQGNQAKATTLQRQQKKTAYGRCPVISNSQALSRVLSLSSSKQRPLLFFAFADWAIYSKQQLLRAVRSNSLQHLDLTCYAVNVSGKDGPKMLKDLQLTGPPAVAIRQRGTIIKKMYGKYARELETWARHTLAK